MANRNKLKKDSVAEISRMIKQLRPGMKALGSLLDEYKDIEDDSWYFKEGTKVLLNPSKMAKGNPKRNEWVDAHKDEVLTIEYDSQFREDKPVIYALKEDETKPKWLFHFSDLLPYKEEVEDTKEN